ncbi:hypothetical protein [Variovorax saccharolyticus]|uniref:hypothetical protein n=1 Tax=Variovorax saccharolyticus TaxID=3053516 RepID=UPI002577C2EB|nr:hypothetical protein [Variovorax sp. J31P216]MDM0029892.1 hypothetical protein [Variovorax sp. J31P216]
MRVNANQPPDGFLIFRAARPAENELRLTSPASPDAALTDDLGDLSDLKFRMLPGNPLPRNINVRAHGGEEQLSEETKEAAGSLISKIGSLIKKMCAGLLAFAAAVVILPISVSLISFGLVLTFMSDEERMHPAGGVRGATGRSTVEAARLPVTTFMHTYHALTC